MKGKATLLPLVALVVGLLPSSTAWAIPSFAKRYDLTCSSCHTAWPLLNAFGRRFKENGYRISRDAGTTTKDSVKKKAMNLYRLSPFSGRIKGYLVDKKKHGFTKIRPFHEVELMAAGSAHDDFSYWVEFEGEDEGDWDVSAETGVLGFHPYQELNVLAGYAPVFWADPYQTLADGGRRMTRAHKIMADLGFATSQKLRKSTPMIAAYGRLGGRFFYTTGISTGNKDPEGEDKKDFFFRGAVDVNDHLMVGGFFQDGNNRGVDPNQNFENRRAGVDFQLEYNNLVLMGAYMRATDDINALGVEENNDVFYTEGMYVFRKGKRALIVPLVRIERYETADGSLDYTDGIFNLAYYPIENIKLSFEFWKNLSTPTGFAESNRVTFLLNVLF